MSVGMLMTVDKGIIVEFYDWVVDCVVLFSPGSSCYAISRIADDWSNNCSFYLAHALPTNAWKECIELLSRYETPSWPWWLPSFVLPDGNENAEAISFIERLIDPGNDELLIFKATEPMHAKDFDLFAIRNEHYDFAKALWNQRPLASATKCEQLYQATASEGGATR